MRKSAPPRKPPLPRADVAAEGAAKLRPPRKTVPERASHSRPTSSAAPEPPRAISGSPPALAPKQKLRGLEDLQRLMSTAVMRPLQRDEGMQRIWSDGSPTAAVAEQFIKPNDRLDSFERLQIYNQQYWWRLLGCFAEDFRTLRAVVGERKFDRLAVAYLETCGSRSWSLRDLGQHLEDFLRERPELTAPQTALALDTVQVEWARVIAFDGAELPPIDPQRIASRTPDRLLFRLQPYLSLLELQHPIDQLIRKQRALQVEASRASNAATAQTPQRRNRVTCAPSRTPIHLAAHRQNFSVYYKRLEPEAHRLLIALRDGANLEDACGTAFADSNNLAEANAEKIRTWFSEWMQLGWLCARR